MKQLIAEIWLDLATLRERWLPGTMPCVDSPLYDARPPDPIPAAPLAMTPLLDRRQPPHNSHEGSAIRPAVAAVAMIAMAAWIVVLHVKGSDIDRREMEIAMRERAIIDREAELQTIASRYHAALLNQRRYFMAARDRWGAFGTIVTAFIAPPEYAEVER